MPAIATPERTIEHGYIAGTRTFGLAIPRRVGLQAAAEEGTCYGTTPLEAILDVTERIEKLHDMGRAARQLAESRLSLRCEAAGYAVMMHRIWGDPSLQRSATAAELAARLAKPIFWSRRRRVASGSL